MFIMASLEKDMGDVDYLTGEDPNLIKYVKQEKRALQVAFKFPEIEDFMEALNKLEIVTSKTVSEIIARVPSDKPNWLKDTE